MTNPDLLDRIAKLSKNALCNGHSNAVESFCQLGLMMDPDCGIFYHHLGLNALSDEDTATAIPHLHKALECYAEEDGQHALEAFRDSVIAHLMDKTPQIAFAIAKTARLRWPDDASLTHLTAQAAELSGDIIAATLNYEQALQQTPSDQDDIGDIAFNLGTLFYKQHKLDKAYKAFRRALKHNPHHPKTWCNLGSVLSDMARPAEAYKAYEAALRVKPDYKFAHSNLLQTMHYLPDQTAATLLPAHRAWGLRHTPETHTSLPTPPKRNRLCVGLVSEDLRKHPVGYFLKGWLPHAKAAGLDIVAYCTNRTNDDLTYELKTHASQWHYVDHLSDSELASRIRADAPDVLLDLAGHTGHNRLSVFGERPCAHQASWMGYVGTTGLTQMDGLIADRIHVPKLEDKSYTEAIWRMPNGYVCYSPPEFTPEPRSEAYKRNGYISFAAFHNPAKINPKVIGTWAKILEQVADSRLRLVYRGYDDANVQEFIGRTFQAHGINLSRIEFHGQLEHAELLDMYNECDFALDSFPYSGGLTALEALWMGIPIITTPGRTFASRHSASHLTFGGFSQDVTTSLSEYIRTAVAWAHSPIMRDADRKARRARFAASPLCDGKSFAQNLAQILHTKAIGPIS